MRTGALNDWGLRTSCMIICSWSSLKIKPHPAWSRRAIGYRLLLLSGPRFGKRQKKINVAPSVHILSWFSRIMFTWSHGYVFFAILPVRFLWKLNQIYHYSPTWNPKLQLPQPPGVLPRRRRHPPTAPCRRHSSSPALRRMDDVVDAWSLGKSCLKKKHENWKLWS